MVTVISVNNSGELANLNSLGPTTGRNISSDGRYITFSSQATNLVAGDTSTLSDVFIRDVVSGTTTRLSVDSSGNEGDSFSTHPTIDVGGRYVAFSSHASNLVANDTNNVDDIFLHDTLTGTTTRVSVDRNGVQGNQFSYDPSVSSGGRFVVFQSNATNLLATPDNNNKSDIFIYDTAAGTFKTKRISESTSGDEADGNSSNASITTGANLVAYQSDATNLVTGDSNGVTDIFVSQPKSKGGAITTRVSVDSSGNEGDLASSAPTISADGRYVAFQSNATNLVAGDTNGVQDIFVHDRDTGATTWVSVDSAGGQADGDSTNASISSDGRYIAFQSDATNLVSGDTNGKTDIFVHDTQTGSTWRISVDEAGNEITGSWWVSATHPSISSDGRYVTFQSNSSLLGGLHSGRDILRVDLRFTPGDNVVTLDSGGENVDGLYGDDTITGGTGADIIVGNAGMDVIAGGLGNDTLSGNQDNDTINGDEGDDVITGGDGDDNLTGGAGNDTIYGDSMDPASLDHGQDILVGGDGDDTLIDGRLDNEIDVMYGGVGNDTYIVNSRADALDIVFEGGAFAGGASDVDTIVSKGVFFWDYYDVGEILTIEATVGANSQLVSGKGDSTMHGNDVDNILLAYGGSNEINPGKGIDTIGLSLYGLAASFNGPNTVKLNAGDDVNYIYDFESGTDKIDTSAYGRFADGAQMLANVADTGWGSLIWMGVHEGADEYIGIVGLHQADLDAGDFLT